MIRIRGGAGIGDGLYVQAVARHLIAKGNRVEACSPYPDLFRPLGEACIVSRHRKDHVDKVVHYASRRGVPGTDQFEDCCRQAGIAEPVDLRLDWAPRNRSLIDSLKGHGKPVVLVGLPRTPFGRDDGYGIELLPDCRVLQQAIDRIRGRVHLVQVGKGKPLFTFTGLHEDLANKTTVPDLIDAAHAASGMIGWASFLVPLGESLRKPLLLAWSRKGTASRQQVIRQITPEKVIHFKQAAQTVMDDCSAAELSRAVDAFLEQVRAAPAV